MSLLLTLAMSGCKSDPGSNNTKSKSSWGKLGEDVQQLMKERNLSEKDVRAALKIYTSTGQKDEYMMVASGGHSGQAMLVGIPSMRIVKIISVFTAYGRWRSFTWPMYGAVGGC